MPGRLRRAAKPAVGGACVLALTLSFVVSRAGGEPQADDAVVPVIPTTKPAAVKTTSLLGPAHELPPLARERPKPAKRKPAAAEAPAPAPRPAPAPAAPPAARRAGLHASAGARDPGAADPPAAAGRAAPADRSAAACLLRRLRLMADARGEKLARAVRVRVAIRHPGLLPARVVKDDGGRLRIQLQRLDAPTLAELLSAGQISRKDGVLLLYSVASAVEALRRAGLVARDLRPGRILVSPEHGAILADTGIPLELMPRTRRDGDAEGAFRSPEERDGKPIGARSNVYSLGVLLRAVLDGPVSSGLPKQVERVIAQATAADPAQRFAGPKEFIVAAVRALGLRIRQRPGGGAELVRVTSEAPAQPPVAAPPKPPPPAKSPQAEKPAQPKKPPRAPAAPGPPRPEPAPEPPRSRKPALALPKVPKPTLPRPSLPRPNLHLPSIPRPRLPKLRWPQMRMPAVPGPRVRSRPSVRALGIAVALAVCVIGGLLLAKLVGDKDGSTQIASSALSVQLPEGWDGTRVDREPSIALSAPLAAAPLGESGTGLVAGRVEDPAELDKRLSAEAARRTEVTLGRLHAWRYSGLTPERGLAAVAYLAPTSDGSVLVICHARRAVAAQRLHECEAIAATIALRAGRPAALASVGEGERAVSDVMDKLRSERRAGRRALAKAEHSPDQASAARGLEASYQDAADSIESSPAIAGQAAALAESLREAAGAYGDLASAAKARDRSGYREASRLVVEREAAVERGAAEPLSA